MAGDGFMAYPWELVDSMSHFLDDAFNRSVAVSLPIVVVIVVSFLCFCSRCRSGRDRDVDPVPHTCLFIDSTWRDMTSVLRWYFRSLFRLHTQRSQARETLLTEIQELCQKDLPSDKSHQHPVLVSTSFKTGLDLFFRVQKYPPGSEVIVTSINARETIQVLLHHGLQVIPLDVTRDKLTSDVEVLRTLICERTVAIMITHLFGRLGDLTAIADLAHENGIHILEDCSQAPGSTPARSANPEADLSFFSFDMIHPCTAFGGAITRIKDKYLLEKMKELQESYPHGSSTRYIDKVWKCTVAAVVLNNPWMTSLATRLLRLFRADLKDRINGYLTAPPPAGLLRLLREQPSSPLLFMLHKRLNEFNEADFDQARVAGDYVSQRLPQVAGQIGTKALVRGYWLYPILVDDPAEVISRLNRLGIDASRNIAQIEAIVSPGGGQLVGVDFSRGVPTTASFIMDHIIYLPVHKRVSKHTLDQICLAVEIVLNKLAILRRHHAAQNAQNAQKAQDAETFTTHPGPYGTITSRRHRDSTRTRRSVSFNPSVSMVSQVPTSSANKNE